MTPSPSGIGGPPGSARGGIAAAAAPWDSLSVEGVRERRHQLLAEASRAAYWRRLARARLDLAVAACAPPDDLVVPADVHLPDPPPVDVLRMLLQDKGSAPGARDVVAWLVGLDETHRRLRHYDEAVRKACAEATDELVRSYCSRPTGCLVAVPHEP